MEGGNLLRGMMAGVYRNRGEMRRYVFVVLGVVGLRFGFGFVLGFQSLGCKLEFEKIGYPGYTANFTNISCCRG